LRGRRVESALGADLLDLGHNSGDHFLIRRDIQPGLVISPRNNA
jgi:hypothetical protein